MHSPVLRCRLGWLLVVACTTSPVPARAEERVDYGDLVSRLHDLRRLATSPAAGETCGSFSSRDRKSRYDAGSGRYRDWEANQDGSGFVRREGAGIVAAEMKGPGVIWRVWSAEAGAGHIKIFVDGMSTPVLDIPFRQYFDSRSGLFAYPELVHGLSGGNNNYVPVPYQSSCKVVLEKGWGRRYQITYSTLPEGARVASFRGEFNGVEKAALVRADQVFAARGVDPKPSIRGEELVEIPVSVPAGGSVDICRLTGSRAIAQVHVVPEWEDTYEKDVLRELALSIAWDGESHPSVWTPLGDFFGAAPGGRTPRSLVSGMSAGGFYSYWFMPFEQSAEMKLRNEGSRERRLTFKILHQPLEGEASPLRFHAKWHRDSFAGVDRHSFERGDRWPDWPVLVTESRGRFCGLQLHVWDPNPLGRLSPALQLDSKAYSFRIQDAMKQASMRWPWDEGDEKFFVDGEKMPSTFGCGTAGYFGYGTGSRTPSEFGSALQNRVVDKKRRGHVSISRFQLADSVPFRVRFEASIEKYHPNVWPLLYAATAYWYQQAGEADLYDPVPVESRTRYYVKPERAVPLSDQLVFEGERHFVKAPRARVQDMRPFGEGWSGGAHFLWDGKTGDSSTIEIEVDESGKFGVQIQLTGAVDYGVFEIQLDGKRIGRDVDLYSPNVALLPLVDLGESNLDEGPHRLTFRLMGSNPAAKAFQGAKFLLGVDYIKLFRRR